MYIVKPEIKVARKGDYQFVSSLVHADAVSMVQEFHYAKGASKTATDRHAILRQDGTLAGVAIWLPPTRVAAESVCGVEWKRVVALSRLVIHPDEPQNAASILLGRSMRQIRQEGRWHAGVSYADQFMCHAGTIYKATNWQDWGLTSKTTRWEDADGVQVAALSTKTRTRAQMEELGYRDVGSFWKRKFVYYFEDRHCSHPKGRQE